MIPVYFRLNVEAKRHHWAVLPWAMLITPLGAPASTDSGLPPFQLWRNEASSINYWAFFGVEMTRNLTNGSTDCSKVLVESTELQPSHEDLGAFYSSTTESSHSFNGVPLSV